MAKKILIIEDNEQDQKIIRRYLSKAGFENIKISGSGEEGLQEAQSYNPDIILLDTVLPGIDGFETCRRLKENNKFKGAIIMMTGRIDAVDADKAKSVGADDYCVKTSDYAVLMHSVKDFDNVTTQQKMPEKNNIQIAEKDQEALERKIQEMTWGLEKTNEGIRILYKELEKKNEELKELDRLKSEFVATVSHELRTPLTIIKGSVGQILDGIHGPITEEQRNKLSMALKWTDSLRRVIDDLLDLAKLEAKNVKLDRKNVDMKKMIQEVVTRCHHLADAKGLAINVHMPDSSIQIEIDHDRIIQVFTNLIGNAIKFTDKGHVDISIRDQGDALECSVFDTGRGIAQEDLPKTFGRFQQFGEKKPNDEHRGTGLGLSICKNIVELHKGSIFVDSELGKGSQFTFILPRK